MTTENPLIQVDQQMVGDIYTSQEVMDNLIILCDEFGSRFGGTEGEQNAAAFLKERMEAYGLHNVHLEPIEYLGWARGQATLTILSPVHKDLPCISLPHSPPSDLEGYLVDMDEGAPDDFEERAAEIKGKIVLTTSEARPKGSKRWIHRNEKYGRSLLAGAAGFIYVNHYPGYGPVTGGIGDYQGAGLAPGISLCKEDGAYLQRLLQRHGEVRVRIHTSDRLEPMTSWNVVGDLPGAENPEQIVMLGSHYDGHDISQGAEDPASGVVALLDAARVLARYAPNPHRTIRFVLWGIEEIGLLGSQQYAEDHSQEMDQLRFYLNMDSAGARANNRDIVLNEWPDLEPLFVAWSKEMAADFAVGQSVNAHSDHYPFFIAGVPTAGISSVRSTSSGRGYGHTRYDTVDKVEQRALREAAALSARLALRVANAPAHAWPAARRSREDVEELLDGPDYREEQAYSTRLEALYAQARAETS